VSDILIAGSGGGKSGKKSKGAVEAPDSLRSIAVARVIDLVSEGPVRGLVDGARSIYLDETPLEVLDVDGNLVRNFSGVEFEERLGTQNQSYVPEFPSSESEVSVGVRIQHDTPITRSISTPGLDAVRVTLSIPTLSHQNTKNGNLNGTSVTVNIAVSENGGAYVDQVIGYDWADKGTISDNVLSSPNPAAGIKLTVKGVNPVWSIIFPPGSKMTYEIQYKLAADAEWTTYKLETIEARVLSQFSKTYEITGLPSAVYQARITNVTGGPATLNSGFFGVASVQDTITGKTMSKYQRSYRVNLPGEGPWSIRVSRITPDSTLSSLQNQTWWESYTEIVDAKFRYPNSALVAVSADASQFQSIPKRAYHMYLREVRVPVNYDPITKSYDGIWNGSFKVAWTNNPAWCFYDLITHRRYGLGHMIAEGLVDKWTLYSIGRYCDELVPSGFTDNEGELIYEPRFSLNCYIQSREDAYKVVQDLASAFRGMSYWAQGTITATQDAPTSPSALFTPANVVDGVFSYTGSAKKARHTVALISWNDPQNLCKTAVEYVEDREGIARYGINELQQVAFGCTSRGQAHRVGRWILYSERYETDMVSFRTGMEGCYLRPGHVIQIADPIRSSKRLGGRVVSADESTVTVDAAVLVEDGKDYFLSCILPDGTLEEVPAYSASTYFHTADGAGGSEPFAATDGDVVVRAGETSLLSGDHTVFAAVFSQPPQPGAVWIMRISDLEPQQFRVISITEPEPATVEIVALEHNPDKYNYIEYGIKLEESTSSNPYPLGYLTPPRNVTAAQELYSDELGTARLRVVVHWEASLDARTVAYLMRWRRDDDNWAEIKTDMPLVTLDNVSPGSHVFQVSAIAMDGLSSAVVSITHLVTGLADAPPDVTGLDTVPAGGAFTALDCELTWDTVISSTFPASLLKHYIVKIYNPNDTLRRTETVLGNAYTYTWAKNSEDGVPASAFKATVVAVAVNDVASAITAQLSASHTTLEPSLSLTATGTLMAIKLRVAGLTREQYQSIEIWSSETNNRAAATLLASTQSQEYTHANLPVAATRYYWIHPIDPFGAYMPWHPLSATAGITGIVISDPSDLIDLLATGEPGAIIVTGTINGTPAAGVNGDMIVDGTVLARHIAADQLIVGDNVTLGENATIEWAQVDNAPNATYLDGNGIYTGTLTADQIESTDFVAQTANIAEAAVGTLTIADNAVTISVGSSSGTELYTYSHTYADTGISATLVNTTDTPIMVLCTFEGTAGLYDTLYVRLVRDTTVLEEVTRSSTILIRDTPGIGTFVYKLQYRGDASSGVYLRRRGLIIIGVKR